jgi:hypothetical protein
VGCAGEPIDAETAAPLYTPRHQQVSRQAGGFVLSHRGRSAYCLVGALFLIVGLSMSPWRQRSDGLASALAMVVIALIGAKQRQSEKIV